MAQPSSSPIPRARPSPSSATAAVITSYGNVVGTSAAWSPDSQTVYITTNTNTLLTHSAFNNWQVTPTNAVYTDVTVTIPHIGAYFAGRPETDGRSYCPTTTIAIPGSNGNPPTTANIYYPLADSLAVQNDRITATTDGQHILGAAVVSGAATLNDISVTLPVTTPCPQPPNAVPPDYFKGTNKPVSLSSITATQIDGIVPATNSARRLRHLHRLQRSVA